MEVYTVAVRAGYGPGGDKMKMFEVRGDGVSWEKTEAHTVCFKDENGDTLLEVSDHSISYIKKGKEKK